MDEALQELVGVLQELRDSLDMLFDNNTKKDNQIKDLTNQVRAMKKEIDDIIHLAPFSPSGN